MLRRTNLVRRGKHEERNEYGKQQKYVEKRLHVISYERNESNHNGPHKPYGAARIFVLFAVALALHLAYRYVALNVANAPYLSVVIVTYSNHAHLEFALESVLYQKLDIPFEVIIMDNGCYPETEAAIRRDLKEDSNVKFKHVRLCSNPGYAIANNVGVKQTSPSSKYVLFLHDDMVLVGDNFLQEMLSTVHTKHKAVGAACLARDRTGEFILESGSIVWEDGTCSPSTRGDEFSPLIYPRPIDYSSGACFMVEKKVWVDYGGLQVDPFFSYYEMADFQMYIQHKLKKYVWFEPNAVAYHHEGGTYGDRSRNDCNPLVGYQASSYKTLLKKWEKELKSHLTNAYYLSEDLQEKRLALGADIRARTPNIVNILYIDMQIPNPSQGRGFQRSFENIKALAELGYRVTVSSILSNSKEWCDKDCIRNITDLTVEVVTTQSWEELLEIRNGFYDIVVVSRVQTFSVTHTKLRDFYRKDPFYIIYDCEALNYRRDEKLLELMNKDDMQFPGGKILMKEPFIELVIEQRKTNEIKTLTMADTLIAVSQNEAEEIAKLLPDTNVKVVGHVVDPKISKTKQGFKKRKGILFIAAFNNVMYYNGDAIWYFLTKIYPLIIEEVKVPIPLTIAGRSIPEELFDLVAHTPKTAEHITFIESPPSIEELYENHRIFIAPHLYGAGIQFKISETIAMGVPVVMSELSASSFGFPEDTDTVCVGKNPQNFKDCVILVHNEKSKWEALQKEGFEFIDKTHNMRLIQSTWANMIREGYQTIKYVRRSGSQPQHDLFNTDFEYPKKECPEGEENYFYNYPDVKENILSGGFRSAFEHFTVTGSKEARNYIYCK